VREERNGGGKLNVDMSASDIDGAVPIGGHSGIGGGAAGSEFGNGTGLKCTQSAGIGGNVGRSEFGIGVACAQFGIGGNVERCEFGIGLK
jgi:hypothetical protein